MRYIVFLSFCISVLLSCNSGTSPESKKMTKETRPVIEEKPANSPASEPKEVRKEASPIQESTDLANTDKPDLTLTQTGQRLLYLHKCSTYTIKIENKGTGPALKLRIVEIVPGAFEFISAEPRGVFKPAREESLATITWNIEEIPAQSIRDIRVDLRAKMRGQYVLQAKLICMSDRPPELPILTAELSIKSLGAPAQHISTYDTEDPCEVGKETIYVIEVRNEGTSNCTRVTLTNEIPKEMEFVEAEGPGTFHWDDCVKAVVFDPWPVLLPGDKLVYKIRCLAITPGPAKNRAILKYHEFQEEIIAEEGTSVYGDGEVAHGYRAKSPGYLRREPVVTIRTKFPETALWEPLLATKDGRCRLDIAIPDAITIQNLSVVASDRKGNVQLEKRAIEVRQNVFVLSSFPATATLGDELVVGALVKNSCGSEQTFTVTLASQDFQIVSDTAVMVSVPDGEGEPVHWRIRPVICGINKFSITAGNMSYIDQEQRTLFVRPVGEPQVQTQKGIITSQTPWLAQANIARDSTYSTAFVNVTFPNSFPALQGVEAMTRYPHG